VASTLAARIELLPVLEEIRAVAVVMREFSMMTVVESVMMAVVETVVMTEWLEEMSGRAVIFSERDQWARSVVASVSWQGDASFAWSQVSVVRDAWIRDALELAAWASIVTFVAVRNASESVAA